VRLRPTAGAQPPALLDAAAYKAHIGE
jgi:hypothetical protein